MSVRGVMKYLTGIGIYRKKAFDSGSVYKKGMDINAVPLMNIDEAADAYEKRLDGMDFSDWMKLQRLEESRGRGGKVNNVGGLMNADD
jgi:hypothetical protein